MNPLHLREQRIKRGVSAAHIARLLSISRGHLCDIEHGRRTLSQKQESLYRKALGL